MSMTTAKHYVARVPKGLRPQESLACAECGAVQWRRARTLWPAYKLLAAAGRMTTNELAAALGISLQNASLKLARLCALGVVEIVETYNHEDGGLVNVYAPTAGA